MLAVQRQFQTYLSEVENALEDTTFAINPDLTNRVQFEELLVPVIGSFSAGKSSLINLLIGAKILPEGLTPETELATEVRYSPEPYVLAIKEDGEEDRFALDELPSLNKRSGDYQFLRVYVDAQSIKDLQPLVLVDMPGHGSALERHNRALQYYMPRGTHFVVVTSIEDGLLSRSMIMNLEGIRAYDAEFTLVLSKCNVRSPEQALEVSEYLTEQAEDYFGERLQVYPADDHDAALAAEPFRTIDPEQLFSKRLLPTLQAFDFNTRANMALAINTVQKSTLHVEAELKEHEAALELLSDQLLDSQEQVEYQAKRLLRQSLARVERDLELATQELGSSSSNATILLERINDIVLNSLRVTISNEAPIIEEALLDKVIRGLRDEISIQGSIDSSSSSVVAQILNEDSIESLKENLKRVNVNLEQWSNSLNEQWDGRNSDGSRSLAVRYRAVTAVLAVTTSFVAPVIELLIIFLPDILRWIAPGLGANKLRHQLRTEVYPKVTSELRKVLPPVIKEQVQALSQHVNATLRTRISEQEMVLADFKETHSHDEAENAAKVAELTELSHSLEALATRYLLTEVAA